MLILKIRVAWYIFGKAHSPVILYFWFSSLSMRDRHWEHVLMQVSLGTLNVELHLIHCLLWWKPCSCRSCSLLEENAFVMTDRQVEVIVLFFNHGFLCRYALLTFKTKKMADRIFRNTQVIIEDSILTLHRLVLKSLDKSGK